MIFGKTIQDVFEFVQRQGSSLYRFSYVLNVMPLRECGGIPVRDDFPLAMEHREPLIIILVYNRARYVLCVMTILCPKG